MVWCFDYKALPLAFQLAMLGYLDTLLTSRIVDAKVVDMYSEEQRWRPIWKNIELVGQAMGNAFCAFFGGIPGAQATSLHTVANSKAWLHVLKTRHRGLAQEMRHMERQPQEAEQ